jgi:hypothetical protein
MGHYSVVNSLFYNIASNPCQIQKSICQKSTKQHADGNFPSFFPAYSRICSRQGSGDRITAIHFHKEQESMSKDHKVRVAIIGVGNCASSLVQGCAFLPRSQR